MGKFIKIAAAIVAFASTPALAVSYDAFSSFTGVNGAGGFSYGYTNGAALTAFTTNGGCALNGASTCLHPSFANIPQASIGGTYPTVAVPTNALLLHPGDSSAQSVYVAFAAPANQTFSYTIALASVGKDTPDGTGYTSFTSVGGAIVSSGTRGTLPHYTSTGALSGRATLAAGESLGVYIDRNISYGGDSTGVNFTLTTVPEPASWALMVVGFGLVGSAARRRSSALAA